MVLFFADIVFKGLKTFTDAFEERRDEILASVQIIPFCETSATARSSVWKHVGHLTVLKSQTKTRVPVMTNFRLVFPL